MTQYRTYLDASTQAGQETILGIQQNGSEFGVGVSTDVVCNNISAGIVTAVNLVVSGITTTTNLIVSGIATVGLGTTSAPSNSQLTFELTSNTNLRIKVRGTDGVLRSANITLA